MTGVLHLREVRHGHLFCGAGGGAKGFNRAAARVGNLEAQMRCVGGIDVDAASIRDFDRVAGVKGTVLDLFDEEQFRAFHDRAPPAGWRPASAIDIQRAFHWERPHLAFLSAPCKGFSGLLAESRSAGPKYQALNGLTLRGVRLLLEAFADDPVELLVFENVPRIATRGRYLLDEIVAELKSWDYAVAETTHDCGELGGLAQSRKRFLLVARHRSKVPPFLYEPPKRRLRGVGEVLELLPLPGDLAHAGPMHRVPALQWKTWVRLAFVEAGQDWRSLNRLRVENGVLSDFAIQPEREWRDGTLGVLPWAAASGAVTAQAEATTGRFSVADPRAELWGQGQVGVTGWAEPAPTVTTARSPLQGRFSVADPRAASSREGTGFLGVNGWAEPAGTVTANGRPGAGAFSVADPREEGRHHGVYGVKPWDEPAGVITGGRPSTGPLSVADPRPQQANQGFQQYGVKPWAEPAAVVTAQTAPGGGPNSVADPRVGADGPRFNNVYRVVPWSGSSPAVTGQGGNSASAVADPRGAEGRHVNGKYRVTAYDEPASTVIAASTTGNGAFVVADPRTTHGPSAHQNKHRVVGFDDAAPTVTGSDRVGSGALSVADPRAGRPVVELHGKYPVERWDEPSRAVIGGRDQGAFSVADPRPAGLNAETRTDYLTGGHYGVTPWAATAGTVSAAGQHDNGPWSVADPRGGAGDTTAALPAPGDRLVAVIRALDGTWHRPFTTLELAALQSYVDPEDLHADFALDGKSDSSWRERIGNMVPPAAAEAVGGEMARTLLMAWSGQTFALSSTPIWVRPLATALSVDPPRSPADLD